MPSHFCIQCGATLVTQLVSGRDRLICPDCGWTMWSRASLGVGGLLAIDGRVLFVERNIQPNAGMWTLVNGYVEADETLDQAVVREFQEETNLRVRPLGLLAIWQTPAWQTPAWQTQPDEKVSPWDYSNGCWCVFGVELVGPLSDLRPDPVEVRRACFYAPHELDDLKPVGSWSRWMAQYYLPGDGALFRQELDPALRAALRNPLTTLYGVK